MLKCDFCKRAFNTITKQVQHMNRQHSDQLKERDAKRKLEKEKCAKQREKDEQKSKMNRKNNQSQKRPKDMVAPNQLGNSSVNPVICHAISNQS